MSSAAFQPRLRLVGGDDPDASKRDDRVGLDSAQLAVIKENRIAAHAPGIAPGFHNEIDTSDPRWILAMQTRARLQGTVLTPERRDELLKNGRRLGLRPFEANLVIAVVQDQARRSATDQSRRRPLSLVDDGRDATSADPQPRRHPSTVVWPQWFAAIAAAAAVVAALIRWLAG